MPDSRSETDKVIDNVSGLQNRNVRVAALFGAFLIVIAVERGKQL